MLSRATVPPAATLPSPWPPQQPSLGLGRSLALPPSAQAASITQMVLRNGALPSAPDCALMSSSPVPLPPAWAFRIDLVSCGQEEGSTTQSCW